MAFCNFPGGVIQYLSQAKCKARSLGAMAWLRSVRHSRRFFEAIMDWYGEGSHFHVFALGNVI